MSAVGATTSISSEPLAVGSIAPDFELRDQNFQRVSLAGLRAAGRVLIVFFPMAFTGTCQGELGYIRDNLPDFEHDGLSTIAISVGAPPPHRVWSSAQGFLFPILSDFWPHGEVATAYGVFNDDAGYANRGTFLVDRDGTILFSDTVGPGEARDEDVWKRALDATR